jgi:hypothetical protein
VGITDHPLSLSINPHSSRRLHEETAHSCLFLLEVIQSRLCLCENQAKLLVKSILNRAPSVDVKRNSGVVFAELREAGEFFRLVEMCNRNLLHARMVVFCDMQPTEPAAVN